MPIFPRRCFSHAWGPVVAHLLLAAFVSNSLAEDATLIDQRLSESVKYLAADELEGRGIGTKGIELAAQYIAKQFEAAGLKTTLFDGSPYQKFQVSVGAKLGSKNELEFVGPGVPGGTISPPMTLAVGKDFNPMGLGGSGRFQLPLVFVGYGITAPKLGYDDYANVDVKDKAVIILRHEPEQANPHSAFNGNQPSEFAPYTRKVSNAYEHGAAAVIFVTDQFEIDKTASQLQKSWQAAVDELTETNAKFKSLASPKADEIAKHREQIDSLAGDIKSFADQLQAAADPLLPFDSGMSDGEGRNFPVLYCRPSVISRLLQAALGTSLKELEAAIEKGPTPHSRALEGWNVVGDISVDRQESEVKNVAAVLEGEGPHAEETIVIGAHYDHLGYGGKNSNDPGSKEIHNGADDNASGTAVLIEVARELAQRNGRLPRRILFLAFTGEERGLWGSARYVRNPLVPLDQTIAMLNMDMVGRLENDKLIVHGTGTATELEPLVDRLGKEWKFEILKKPGGYGPSDHSSFYAQKVPVLHFFTGSHSDYHRPSDDVEKLNVEGMRRVAGLVTDIAVELAKLPDPLHFQEIKAPAILGGGGDRPYFGSVPDFSQDKEGYALLGVTKGSPADKGGLKAGDIIVRVADSKIGNLEDFDSALRKHHAGEKVPVVVKRAGEEVELSVTLGPPR